MAGEFDSRVQPLLVELASGTRLPIPDPTVLTTAAVDRATEIWRRELAAALKTIEVEIESFKDLKSAHFNEVNRRIDDIERKRIEDKQNDQAHLNTILTALHEAINKSEAGFKEQLSQLKAAQDTLGTTLRQTMDDNKDNTSTLIGAISSRVTAVEAAKQGVRENTNDNWNAIVGIAAAVAIILSIITWVSGQHSSGTISASPPITVAPPAHVEVK